ncbi:interleukin 15, like isoform X3 [Onychostoma macrolepis]|uniref:interleukin 15, like isoform X3 n=1 Tax=Onychostoma macrolepis TaxID=369639 RepID=UPI00272B67C1|nr:interleukin 15, like isoform X3 [Onychostoma macrolepis]
MTDVLVRESWIFDMRTDLLHYSMHFASLFLYLLIMLTRQIKCQSGCSKESVEMVKRIARELSQVKNDSMLYTPTLDDYEQNCSKSTLMCFALEVNVLFVEIQNVAKYRSHPLPRVLKTLTDKDKMKPCPDCEFYQEKRTETFLQTLQDVLQRMNAEKSCAPKKNKRHLENFIKKNK